MAPGRLVKRWGAGTKFCDERERFRMAVQVIRKCCSTRRLPRVLPSSRCRADADRLVSGAFERLVAIGDREFLPGLHLDHGCAGFDANVADGFDACELRKSRADPRGASRGSSHAADGDYVATCCLLLAYLRGFVTAAHEGRTENARDRDGHGSAGDDASDV